MDTFKCGYWLFKNKGNIVTYGTVSRSSAEQNNQGQLLTSSKKTKNDNKKLRTCYICGKYVTHLVKLGETGRTLQTMLNFYNATIFFLENNFLAK